MPAPFLAVPALVAAAVVLLPSGTSDASTRGGGPGAYKPHPRKPRKASSGASGTSTDSATSTPPTGGWGGLTGYDQLGKGDAPDSSVGEALVGLLGKASSAASGSGAGEALTSRGASNPVSDFFFWLFGARKVVPYIAPSELPTYFAGGAGERTIYTHDQWKEIQSRGHLVDWNGGRKGDIYPGHFSSTIWRNLHDRGALPKRFYTHDEWRAILAAEK